MCVCERDGGRGERNRNSEIGKYLDRETEAETKRALASGGILVLYHPIFKFKP